MLGCNVIGRNVIEKNVILSLELHGVLHFGVGAIYLFCSPYLLYRLLRIDDILNANVYVGVLCCRYEITLVSHTVRLCFSYISHGHALNPGTLFNAGPIRF